LLGATNIATIFLDERLRIKRYTPPSVAIFNLIPGDAGRPLAELTHRLEFNSITEDAEQVLRTLVPVEREVRSAYGRWFLARIIPYRTMENMVAGVVLTFVDINERKRAEEGLRASRQRLSAIFSQAAVGLSEISFEGRFLRVNDELCRMLGRSRAELLMSGVNTVTYPEDMDECIAAFRTLIETGAPVSIDKRYLLPQGGIVWANSILTRLDDERGNPQAVLSVTVDLTVRKQAERQVLQAREELERRVHERTLALDEANQALRAEIEERQRMQSERQDLLRQMVTAQEEERGRISRELHDEVGQHITALILGLKSLESRTTDAISAATLKSLMTITEDVGRETHQLAVVLRPTALDDLGLLRTLSNYAEEWSARTNIAVTFHSTGMEAGRLPRHIETTLYRIACEALNNVLKHSEARHVSIILERREPQASIIVEDNGKGFDVEAFQSPGNRRRLGLLGMKERATLLDGELTIESSPGQGTTVFVRIPLVEKPAAAGPRA
ncbi:MAG TPA: PAS domain-containing protein, partial [Rariglobus sp.]